MKMKRKVQKNLPQLIEWLLESGKSECIVISNMNNIVRLEPYGVIRFSQEKFYPEEIFTVEVDEEITEETVIPKMLVKFKNLDTYGRFKNDSINGFEIEEGNIEAFYILNDDKTLTLIWRDGKLVD